MTTSNTITPSIIPKPLSAVPSPLNNNTVVSVAKSENTNSNDTVSFQEDNEPHLDPKKCDIKPGKETTIEITKERIGLGLSIVGGSDTPLVSRKFITSFIIINGGGFHVQNSVAYNFI